MFSTSTAARRLTDPLGARRFAPRPAKRRSQPGRMLHAVTLCVYFNDFMRLQKTLAVIPAIAAGIVDKVLHEVGCAALMNANQAPALRGPYKKRVTEIEISN